MAFGSISILWNKWNIRGFVMLSLWLQVFLILFAPLRKKTSNWAILSLLWLAYLMADWVATFAIGLISYNQSNMFTHVAEVDGALLAFWASFLLLHLGGPDTITAFSMEDSSLWRRHLLNLVFQVGSGIYVFMQIFPTNKSLLIPTMLVFLAGVIKNVERTVALNSSSLPKLKDWPFSQRKHLDDVASKFEDVMNLKDQRLELVNLDERIVVKHAYYLFQMFMVLLGDLMFTFRERQVSREYFHKISPMDALRVISVELQFMYEMLYTKTLVIRSVWSYIFRFIAFTNVATAFVLFNHLKKHQLPDLDLEITYSLFFGGIALDVIALLMLVFSDWTVVGIEQVSFHNKFIVAMSERRKPQFTKCESHANTNDTYTALDTPLIFQRWSESISACKLLSQFMRTKTPRKKLKRGWCSGIIRSRCWGVICRQCVNCGCCLVCFPCICCCCICTCCITTMICIFQKGVKSYLKGVKSFLKRPKSLDNMFESFLKGLDLFLRRLAPFLHFRVPRIANAYVSKNPFIKELWIFIFEEVRYKSQFAIDEEKVREIFEAKGDWFLKSEPRGINCGVYVTKFNFDASIIIWHIATEICYNRETSTAKNEKREFSMILSEYMMYLLLNQSDLVSTVAGIAQIRSASIYAKIYGRQRDVESLHSNSSKRTESAPSQGSKSAKEMKWNSQDVKELCASLYDNFSERTESVLSQGIKLAKKLEEVGEDKWKVMSGVWVEMLSYAAAHIKGEKHVQVLSQGGELLAFVWLLMAHFGCFYNPEWGIGANYEDLLLFDKTQDGEPGK